jgi:hypothetical protein
LGDLGGLLASRFTRLARETAGSTLPDAALAHP